MEVEGSVVKQHFRVTEVAELLDVSERTIRRWISKGLIPTVRIQHTRRIPGDEIANLMRVLNCHNLTSIDRKSESRSTISFTSPQV